MLPSHARIDDPELFDENPKHERESSVPSIPQPHSSKGLFLWPRCPKPFPTLSLDDRPPSQRAKKPKQPATPQSLVSAFSSTLSQKQVQSSAVVYSSTRPARRCLGQESLRKRTSPDPGHWASSATGGRLVEFALRSATLLSSLVLVPRDRHTHARSQSHTLVPIVAAPSLHRSAHCSSIAHSPGPVPFTPSLPEPKRCPCQASVPP